MNVGIKREVCNRMVEIEWCRWRFIGDDTGKSDLIGKVKRLGFRWRDSQFALFLVSCMLFVFHEPGEYAIMIQRVGNTETEVTKSRKRCLKKFLFYFRKGYSDLKYISWERQYKETAHEQFREQLNKKAFQALLKEQAYETIAQIAVKIESRTNLLFSFEKMALRDAVKSPEGAKAFAVGLFNYIYGTGDLQQRFEAFVHVIAGLPRKQTRVLTWPLVTVFGFIGNPKEHIFLKPTVTKTAAEKYGFEFNYRSAPNWETYQSLLAFAALVKKDTIQFGPKDYIDLQSFIWVMGSDEYPD